MTSKSNNTRRTVRLTAAVLIATFAAAATGCAASIPAVTNPGQEIPGK